jgi:50S ribosomal subunit-associated GTPase HflX
MSEKVYIYGIAGFIIVLVAIFNRRMRASFGKFRITSERNLKKNKARVNGEGNKVKQGIGKTGKGSSKSKATIKGDNNDIQQG